MLYRSMLKMADFAADYGVQICVENIEIDTVACVVEFLERVGRENVGMTLDLGHACLASKRLIGAAGPALREAHPRER